MSNYGRPNQVTNEAVPPWEKWRVKDRAARAVKFIEAFCVPAKGFTAGQPLLLARYQKEWLEQVFADDVSAAAMLIARGNGKSSFLAAVALHALFDADESGAPQIPMVATTLKQAHLSVYGVALTMAQKHPELRSRTLFYRGIGTQRMVTPHNAGELFPISNDVDGLQGLDPSLAVCDELGFMPFPSWGALVQASGKRPRSLVAGIGTPGFSRESALWWLREKVLAGEDLPGFSFTEYSAPEGCPIGDEDLWFAANPALAEGYLNIKALRTDLAIMPEAHFRIFRLGQWVDGVECWLGEDGHALWRSLADPWDMGPDEPTWVGVDVGLKHDSTAVVWCQQHDHRVHVKSKIWLPKPDGRLDVADCMQHIRDLGQAHQLAGVFYDPRFFDLPAQMLADEGYPIIEFPQSVERLSPAVGATYETIKRGELSHDGTTEFETQVLNAVARYNERGFTLAKSKSGRIDAAVAMCMAVQGLLEPGKAAAPAPWAVYA